MKRAFTHLEHRRGVRPGNGRRPVPALTAVTAMAVLSALLLAGCGSGGSTDASTEGKAGADASSKNSAPGFSAPDTSGSAASGNSAAAEPQSGAPGAAPAPGVPDGAAAPAKPSGSVIPKVSTGTKLTRNASLDLRVTNIETAAARVRAVATGLQAQILTEQIGKVDPGVPTPLQGDNTRSSVPGSSGSGAGSPETGTSNSSGSPDTGTSDSTTGFGTLTLSVPADKLDAGLDQLARIGTVLRRNTSSEDVTAQFVDTESRLKTMRASVERVRALMAKANDLGQVVVLEGELSRRESDLESLQSQLTSLEKNVERSTVTVSLSTLGVETVKQAGFGAGLSSGWDAFAASAAGLAKALGAVLPFALFFALVSAPVVWWWRRRSHLPAQPASTA